MRLNYKVYNQRYKQSAEARGIPIKDNKAVMKYKRSLSGKSLSDIDIEFHLYILELLQTAHEYSVPERNEIVETVTTYYQKLTGLHMPRIMLVALADFILNDELTNRDIDKITNNAFPFLSYRQLQRRSKRELLLSDEVTEYLGNVKAYNLPDKQKNTATDNINQ